MCTCQNCGVSYSVDIIIPDELWKAITPRSETDDGGLLCPKCIGEKIEYISGYDAYKLVRI